MSDKGGKCSSMYLKGCANSTIPNLISNEGEVINHHMVYHYSCAACAINQHDCEKCNRRSKTKKSFNRLICDALVHGGNDHTTQYRRKFKQTHHQQGGLTYNCCSTLPDKHCNDNSEVGSPDDFQINGDSHSNNFNHGQVASGETTSFENTYDTLSLQEETYDEKECTSIINTIGNKYSPSSTCIHENYILNAIQTTDWGNMSSKKYFVDEFSGEHQGPRLTVHCPACYYRIGEGDL